MSQSGDVRVINSIDQLNVSPQSYLVGYEPIVRVITPTDPKTYRQGETIKMKMGSYGTSHIVIRECAYFGDLRFITSSEMSSVATDNILINPAACQVRVLDHGVLSLIESFKEISNGIDVSYLDRANSDYISDMRNLCTPGYKNELTLFGCGFFDAPYFNYLMRIDEFHDISRCTSKPCTVQFPIPTIMEEVLGFPTYKSAEPFEIHIKLATNNSVFKIYAPGQRRGSISTSEYLTIDSAVMIALNANADLNPVHVGGYDLGDYGVCFHPKTQATANITHEYTLENVRFIAYCLKTDNRGVRDNLPLVIWADVTSMQKQNSTGQQAENWTVSWQYSNVSKLKILPAFTNISFSQIGYIVAVDLDDETYGLTRNPDYYEMGINPISNIDGTGKITHYKIRVFGKTFPYEGGCGAEDTSSYPGRNYQEMFRSMKRYYGSWDSSGERHMWAMTMGSESTYHNTNDSSHLGGYKAADGTLTEVQGGSDPNLVNPDFANPIWDSYGKFLYSGYIKRYSFPVIAGGGYVGGSQNLDYIQGPALTARHHGSVGGTGHGGYFGIYQSFNVLGDSQHGMAQGLAAARLPIQIYINRSGIVDEALEYLIYVTSRRRYVLSKGGTNLDI